MSPRTSTLHVWLPLAGAVKLVAKRFTLLQVSLAESVFLRAAVHMVDTGP
jgi:hypothetical protein